MPNIAKVLKEEIARISRHETKVAITPLRKPAIRLRKDVAELRTRLAALELANKELRGVLARFQAAQPEPAAEPATKGRISGKGIRSLRKRLGLSQSEFARLAGVSDQAVYLWERREGMLKLRNETRAALFALRGVGAREAKKRLETIGNAAAVTAQSRAAKRR